MFHKLGPYQFVRKISAGGSTITFISCRWPLGAIYRAAALPKNGRLKVVLLENILSFFLRNLDKGMAQISKDYQKDYIIKERTD